MSINNRNVNVLRNVAIRSIKEVGLNQYSEDKLYNYIPAKPATRWRKAKPERFIKLGTYEASKTLPAYHWLHTDGKIYYLPFIWIEYIDNTFERYFALEFEPDSTAEFATRKSNLTAQVRYLDEILGHIKTQLDRVITGEQLEELRQKAITKLDIEIKIAAEQADCNAQVAASQD